MKIILALALLFILPSSFACMCDQGTVQENIKLSSWALRVKISQIDYVPRNLELKKNGYNKVTFDIKETFKSSGSITSFTESASSCGFPTYPDQEAILFVTKNGRVSRCSRSVVNDESDPYSVEEFHKVLLKLRQLPNKAIKQD